MGIDGTAAGAPKKAVQRPVAGWTLAAGLAVLAMLWLGPLPAASRTAFSLHMILHLGVAVVAAPLVAIGMVRLGLRLAEGERMLPVALAAAAAEMVAVWGWHTPALHTAAAQDGRVFMAQQASFLAAGFAVWLVSFSGRSRAASGIGALTMLATFMHMAMLGVLLTVAPGLLYPPEICLGAFGLDQLADQRLGGGLMAVGGGAPYLLGGLVLARRFIGD